MNGIRLKTGITCFLEEILPDSPHLSLDVLYHLSLENGLKEASEDTLDHLWQCRECLEKWEIFSTAWDPGADIAGEPVIPLGVGMLRAAATGVPEFLVLTSRCHRFRLGIHPDEDAPEKGLVTLDVVSDGADTEGKTARVRDAAGKMVIEKTIVGGRAAVKKTDLNELDLSVWTITFSGNREPDIHE